jgi:AraC-like DNA-binding protein
MSQPSGTNYGLIMPSVDCGRVLTVVTDDLPERERDAMVRDYYGRICMRLELAPAEDGALQMSARTSVLPGMTLTRAAVAPMSWMRTRDLTADGSDDLCISWMEGGYRFQDLRGQDVEVPPGAPCLMPMQEIWRATTSGGGATQCIQVSQALLAPLCNRLGDLAADAIRMTTVEGRLLTSYLQAATHETFDEVTGLTVQRHMLDLLSLALGAGRDAREQAASGIRAARLHAAKRHVAANINAPHLTADSTGRAIGLSARYVRELFADTGTSFLDYVQDQRLERIRLRLADPAHDIRAIADIAFDEGFAEPSTFYRRFKNRFGCAPSDFRRRESLLRHR